jgi:hypothetical protein
MLEALASLFLNKLPDFFSKLFEKPKIKIGVKEFHYDLFENKLNDSIVVIGPYTSVYYTRLTFSNIGRRLTTITDVRVVINNKMELFSSAFNPIRLEPGEFFERVVIFPVKRDEALNLGTFEIKVLDSFGKIFRCVGQFPLTHKVAGN